MGKLTKERLRSEQDSGKSTVRDRRAACGNVVIMGTGLFRRYDYSDDKPMHKSPAQGKDGVLRRHATDPDRFYLIGERRSIEEHAAIRKQVAARPVKPEYRSLIVGEFAPFYVRVTTATLPEYLDKKG